MSELERQLHGLGEDIAWPATPRFELALEPRSSTRLRRAALAFAVLAAALAGVLALSPGARSAFLEIFHLDGASVELVDTLPEVAVRTPFFGERVTEAEAEAELGLELLGLAGEEPDSIHLRGSIVTLVYGDEAAPRLTLTQLRGGVYDGFVKKAGQGGTRVEEVRVGGEPGLFVSGDEHFVMFLDGAGEITDEPTYLAGTVLLWNRGGLLLRLEGDLTRAQALELAAAVR